MSRIMVTGAASGIGAATVRAALAAGHEVAALDADRDASLTQLFYYTYVMHDWLYGHGFDEASGKRVSD